MRAPEGIVTPEAVRLQFEEATVGSRAVALVIDWSIQAAAILVLSLASALLAGAGLGVPDWLGVTIVLILVLAVLFGYPIAFETLRRGRTPGKAAMGLRVVTVEGAPVRFRHAAVRAALGLVDFGLTYGVAAVISAMVSKRSQRLGDMVAGTIVLRERTGAGAPQSVAFAVPPGAEAFASTIDVSGLRVQDYVAVRTFLLRAGQLPEASRKRIAADLSGTIARRLGHATVDEASAELFLTCAAARYQDRAGSAASERQRVHASSDHSMPTAPAARSRQTDDGFHPPG